MNVIVIPMFSDNFCYYIYASDIKDGVYVDLAEASRIPDFQKEFGIEGQPVKHIMTTHKHWDHAGGNKEMQAAFPDVVITGGEEDKVDGCTQPVVDKQSFELFGGSVKVTCLHTPCHTRGHTCFYLEMDSQSPVESSMQGSYKHIKNLKRCVFTGDMVFIGGCGRFFEGTPAEMLSAMDLMLTLPEDTSIFCGHEYTKANFEFVLKIEDKSAYWAKYKAMLDSGTWTTPSLLKDEKEFNVFMRCRVPQV